MTLPLTEKLSTRTAPAVRIAREAARGAVDAARPHVEEAAASWKRWATGSRRNEAAERVTRYQDDLRDSAGGDRRREVVRLNNLSSTYRRTGDLTNAQVCASRALEVARETGDLRLLGLTLNGIGLIQAQQPAPRSALASFGEARDVFRGIGDRQIEGQILANLGTVFARLGERDRAKASWAEALGVLADDSSAHEQLAGWLASHPEADPAEDETAERQPESVAS